MILISHRGNINGKIPNLENSPNYIKNALNLNYNVEIDVWHVNSFYTGHDNPQYSCNILDFDIPEVWFHAKNDIAFFELLKITKNANVFWHQNDDFTLTNKGFIWTYPNKNITNQSICVLPEQSNYENISVCRGICSDFISAYKQFV